MEYKLSTLSVSILCAVLTTLFVFFVYLAFVEPWFNPLRNLPGPPSTGLFKDQLGLVTNPSISPRVQEAFVKQYGRNVMIRGILPWDQRLFTLDPVTLSHVMKNSHVYEKPWHSRRLIIGLIGCGMLAAEGQVHKRQRRVATPAFSVQNMRALVPLVFVKGNELKERWAELIAQSQSHDTSEKAMNGAKLDVCHWVSRATFDVIGSAGFDYKFNAIQDETNELFSAYKEMFEIGVSQQEGSFRGLVTLHFPFINTLFPDKAALTVQTCQEVIRRVAGQLVQEKKHKIAEAERSGSIYQGKDLLTLLLKSNGAADLPPEQRISDEDILHNINTFMFAGSDTSSLAITWMLYLLAKYPAIQTRLRHELLTVAPPTPLSTLTSDEVVSLYSAVAELPYLENVMRETLRLIPPVHSSIRVATRDGVLPTSVPVRTRMPDGSVQEVMSIRVPKGALIHVPVEGFNLDREVWGTDGWAFNPDRWDKLPEAVKSQPGLYNNTLTFSAGPRSCIGMRFSVIEMKTFLFILLTSFTFAESDEKVGKANVVLTRPYVVGKHLEGSKCPLLVTPYVRESAR
ncbi:cytochrome P450 [Laetiporus sulphureus 93-53]|uniref:Cytochrome P450 n=1 Tax=Laetiporus sulphureus 93-53 TaxID=1314785 RepID=A0A165HJE3_9APHY|nr:cytochrome P450 [Laetiporus sulphureus 93-53]KZT11803.1 cytochrome P450 [Laetiporus sulphureus 93-53]